MRRGIAIGVPGLTLATVGGLWVQAKHVANAPLPHFDDLDPTGRYGDPTAATRRIVVLGDSSMTGPGLDHPSQIWHAVIAASLPWDVHLHSVAKGGSRVRDVLVEQLPAAIEAAPDLYVVSVGANDTMHATPVNRFRRDLAMLLDLLGSVAPVVTLGIGDLAAIPRLPLTLRALVSRRSASIDRAHAQVTRDRPGAVRVPVSELSDERFAGSGAELFAADLFHPNERGHAVWAELFDPYIRTTLERADAAGADGVIDLRDRDAEVCAT